MRLPMPNGPSERGKASAGEPLPAAMGFGGPSPAPSRNSGAPSGSGAPRGEMDLDFRPPERKSEPTLSPAFQSNHEPRPKGQPGGLPAVVVASGWLPTSSLECRPTNGGHNGQRAGEGRRVQAGDRGHSRLR